MRLLPGPTNRARTAADEDVLQVPVEADIFWSGYGHTMALPVTPDAFYDGAKEFAHSALEAHHAGKYRRVAIDAGTALEHLAKACLARRSPALLTELKGERNFQSLLRLLGIAEGGTPRPLRTVGLRDALERARTFVKSVASANDLMTLVDLRDGSIHGAENEEVEERLLVAFVQQADAFLQDLRIPREVFWAGQLPVVSALLTQARDKIAHRVKVKLAEARASFERQYGGKGELLDVVRRLSIPKQSDPFEPEESIACPACASSGVASGIYDVEWGDERDKDGLPVRDGSVQFLADDFECRVCGLRLTSQAELTAAGLKTVWEVGQIDRNDYWSFFDEGEDEGEGEG